MSFKKNLLDSGFTSDHLDEVVQEAADRLAKNANADGMTSQIRFLNDTCCWSDEEILAALEGQAEE